MTEHDLDSDLLRELTREGRGEPLALVDRDGRRWPPARSSTGSAGQHGGYALAASANQAGVPIRVVKLVSDDASKGPGRTWRGAMAEAARALADWTV